MSTPIYINHTDDSSLFLSVDYMLVENDAFELPVAIGHSLAHLSSITGVARSTLHRGLKKPILNGKYVVEKVILKGSE